jgi:hypothetical protein
MNRYCVRAARGSFLNPYSPPPSLTAPSLAGALTGASVRAIVELPFNRGYDVEVQYQKSSHGDALDEIVEALGQFGLQFVEGRIAVVTTAALESALAGGAGGGALGSTTKDAGVTIGSALVGLLVGGAVGSQIERIVSAYVVARPHPMASWQLTALPVRRAGDSGAPGWAQQ